MRNRKAFLSLGLIAAAGLVAAAAMAADPLPPQSCDVCGFSLQATGPTVGPCTTNPAKTCTKIEYTVLGGTSTPDHVGIFLRAEAGIPTVTPASATYNITSPCTKGDYVIGVGDNVLCHERLIRINNQTAKSSTFGLEVLGNRAPIATSVVVKKGRSSQAACRIVGIGLEDMSSGNCVHQCGGFDPKQAVRAAETFKFKGCEVGFEFSPTTGEVTSFYLASQGPGASCNLSQGPVADLSLTGGPIFPADEILTFGDGWISSGNNSCATRLIAGRYYTVCE